MTIFFCLTCKIKALTVNMKLLFVCLYECYGIKLETAYEQAQKTGLKRIFHKEKRERAL